MRYYWCINLIWQQFEKISIRQHKVLLLTKKDHWTIWTSIRAYNSANVFYFIPDFLSMIMTFLWTFPIAKQIKVYSNICCEVSQFFLCKLYKADLKNSGHKIYYRNRYQRAVLGEYNANWEQVWLIAGSVDQALTTVAQGLNSH